MIKTELFKDIPISESIKLKAMEFLNRYKSDQYLYPSALARYIKEKNQICRLICEKMVSENIVEEIHYFICSQCSEITNFYDVNEDIGDLWCERCDKEIDTGNYYIAYKFK